VNGQSVNYSVTVHHEDGSFWAEVDDLPGCFAQGATMEELMEALTEAVGLYLSTPETTTIVELNRVSEISTSESFEARVLVC
jgi:predicted RNase H-like HicB family nuclease